MKRGNTEMAPQIGPLGEKNIPWRVEDNSAFAKSATKTDYLNSAYRASSVCSQAIISTAC